MAATFRHFAINADDVERAKRFYERVFGWEFSAWGPPDFYQIKNAGAGLMGALQARRELAPGQRATTFETTMGVEDIKAVMKTAEDHGGKVVFRPYRIEGVGDIGYIEDPEGNICGVAQYLPGVWGE